MSTQIKWSEHILIRSLTDPKLEKVNRKIFAELKQDLFVSSAYLEAYRRLDSVYAKQNRFLTFHELVQDSSVSEETRRYIRAREVKRKSGLQRDASLARPRNYEEYQSVFRDLTHRARHAGLIDLHNDLSGHLKEDMLSSDIENLIIYTRDSLSRIESLATSKSKLFEVNKNTVRDRLKQFYKELKNRMFIPTGYKDFDNVNVGIPRDSLFIIAGKTGSGKSSLALDMSMKMKAKFGARVCFLPLEMSIEQMLIRMGANLIGVPANELVKNFKKYYKDIVKSMDEFLAEADDDPACFHFYEPEEGETIDVSLKTLAVQNYDIIYVDYLGLMSPMGGEEGWKGLDLAGRFGKRWSSKNKTCVCYLAQLDDTTDVIRYARALGEHGSNFWKWRETLFEIMETGTMTIEQVKARNQAPIPFKLRVDLPTCRFSDYIIDENDEDNTDNSDSYARGATRKGHRLGSKAKDGRRRKPLAKGFDSDVPDDDDI